MDTTASKRYNAAIYVRLSKEDALSSNGVKAESNSISNQKQLILDFVKDKADIAVVSIREDDGYTGTDYDRPDFQHMMDDIKAGIVNCVIVKDLSRFGREYINAGKYIHRLFPYYGVRLIAINDGIDTVTQDSSDNFNIMVKNLMNDNYCRDISIKIRSQLQVKRKSGEFIGAFAPYGYEKADDDKNKLVIDIYAAEVVRDIFRYKLDGLNNQAIANELNNQGVLSPLEYKKSKGSSYSTTFKTSKKALWGPIAVLRILSNPVYKGTLVQGIRTRPNYKIKAVQVKSPEDWCIVENAHEAIIPEKSYLLVQRLLELDTRTSPKEAGLSPLAGMVYCGDCGSPMTRKTQSSGGKKFYYYLCSNHKRTGQCSTHTISKKLLEDTVFQLLKQHISVLMELDCCLSAIQEGSMTRLNIQKAHERLLAVDDEMARYRKLKFLAYEDLKDGILSQEDYIDITTQYDERIHAEQAAADQIQKELNLYLSGDKDPKSWIKDFIHYQNISELSRRVAVDCIERIDIYEGKRIEVEFTHMQDYNELISQLQEFNLSQKGVS